MGMPVIDFKEMNVISITRGCGLDPNETVIKYKIDGKIDRFYAKCSDNEHEILAKRFMEYLAQKSNLFSKE